MVFKTDENDIPQINLHKCGGIPYEKVWCNMGKCKTLILKYIGVAPSCIKGNVELRNVGMVRFFQGHHLMTGWWCNFVWVTFSTTILIMIGVV